MLAQVRPDLPTEPDLEVPATPAVPALSTPAPRPALPSLPSLPAEASSSTAGTDIGTTADNPIIFSSDSDVASTPVRASESGQPFPHQPAY